MKSFEMHESIKTVALGCAASITAAGAGDATELTGEVIDRLGFNDCTVLIPFKAALDTDETLKFTVKVAESDDGSSFGSDETIADEVTVAAQEAAGTTQDCYKLKVNLAGEGAPRKRYLKFKVTPDLSRGATDTAIFAAVCVLGGATTKPVAAWAAATA